MRSSIVVFLIFIAGCAAGAERAPAAAPMPSESRAEAVADVAGNAAPAKAAAPSAPPAPQSPAVRDLVIYTAHYAMAVYQVDQGIAAVERIAKEQSGHLAVKKDREITIRVPRARFEAALAEVDKVGDVVHRDIEATDVTDEHVDLEIRIKNARAVQKQLTDLLGKASVKEALDIERELARVTQDLELLEGKLKLLNDKVAFSTISVTFEARGTTVQTERVRLPFPWLNTLNLPTLLQLGEDK